MDVKHEINPKAFIFTLPHSFLIAAQSEESENLTILYKSHPGARGKYRHNGLFLKSSRCHRDYLSTYVRYISYVQTDLAKFKGLFIKIKVVKGFSAKLKVLKDCNQIKGF